MIQLSIFNMNDFLQTVNSCTSSVNLLRPDGRKENIKMRPEIQQDLQRQYQQNHHFLRLALDIPDYRDYMNLVFFSIGDH